MPVIPNVTIQLMHLQGPFEGQVDEFKDFPIHIGRHSTCQICYGNEMTSISRHHAKIECKANRFRIIDISTNGTFINGRRIANVYLRDGDVISFSEGGPKVSFTTRIGTDKKKSAKVSYPRTGTNASHQPSESMVTFGADQEIQVFRTNAPLTIQIGNTRQHFMLLPITIGSDASCDFVIADGKIAGRHVQLFFTDNLYYAKDLTGEKKVTVNGRPIEKQSVLAQGAELSLTEKGPKFKFHGDGYLSATDKTAFKSTQQSQPSSPSHKTDSSPYFLKVKENIIKKFLK